MEKYLQEAFKAFEELNEDVFDISTVDGLEKAKEFEDEPVWDDREEEIIIDPLAETEEELKKDYIGKAILQCEICQSMIYKNPDEVVIDEETQLANIDEVCPFCQSEDGFKVIGEIKEFCDDEECEEKHEEEETEESEEPVEEKSEEEVEVSSEEEIEESIKTRKRVRTEELTESDKPAATSIEDAQKWVDFDMKRYGKISERTNELVKKAGFQIIKDDHGDYEVTAGKFESCEKELKESFDNLTGSEYDQVVRLARDVADNLSDVIQADIEEYGEDSGKKKVSTGTEFYSIEVEDFIHDYRGVENKIKDIVLDLIDNNHNNMTWYDLIDTLNGNLKALKEDFNKVDIETDTQKMSMESDESGKVTVTTEPKTPEIDLEAGTEVIAPVSDEVKAEFKSSEEENAEEPEEIDYDFDEFEEKDFDSLGEGFLKRVYENVKSFKTTSGKVNGNEIMLEGLITFKSGKQAKTNFIFEAYKATKTGKLKFIGENKQFAQGKKSFTLSGKADGKKLVCESLTYNYCAKAQDGSSKRLYGTIRK